MRFERVCLELVSRVVAVLCFAAHLLRALSPTLGPSSHPPSDPPCILTQIVIGQSSLPPFPPCPSPSLSFF